MFSIKVVFSPSDIRRFSVPSGGASPLTFVLESVSTHFRPPQGGALGQPPFHLKFEDEEGELCTIANDAELSEAVDSAKRLGKTLKVFVFPNEVKVSPQEAASECVPPVIPINVVDELPPLEHHCFTTPPVLDEFESPTVEPIAESKQQEQEQEQQQQEETVSAVAAASLVPLPAVEACSFAPEEPGSDAAAAPVAAPAAATNNIFHEGFTKLSQVPAMFTTAARAAKGFVHSLVPADSAVRRYVPPAQWEQRQRDGQRIINQMAFDPKVASVVHQSLLLASAGSLRDAKPHDAETLISEVLVSVIANAIPHMPEGKQRELLLALVDEVAENKLTAFANTKRAFRADLARIAASRYGQIPPSASAPSQSEQQQQQQQSTQVEPVAQVASGPQIPPSVTVELRQKLLELHGMGFTNTDLNLLLLQQHRCDIQRVVEWLVNHDASH